MGKNKIIGVEPDLFSDYANKIYLEIDKDKKMHNGEVTLRKYLDKEFAAFKDRLPATRTLVSSYLDYFGAQATLVNISDKIASSPQTGLPISKEDGDKWKNS